MSANILVVEYEPRYVEHVRAALAEPEFRLEIVASIDRAIDNWLRHDFPLRVATRASIVRATSPFACR